MFVCKQIYKNQPKEESIAYSNRIEYQENMQKMELADEQLEEYISRLPITENNEPLLLHNVLNMSTYHILKNGMPMEVSEASLRKMQESQENITLDVQWYLNHGGVRFEDFKKTHL